MTDRRPRRRPSAPTWTTDPVPTDPLLGSPGFYSKKLVAGGPDVPCRLYTIEDRDEDGELQSDVIYKAEVDSTEVDALAPPGWPWRRIDEATWRFMKDDAAYCREHLPDSPKAQPNRPATESPKQYF